MKTTGQFYLTDDLKSMLKRAIERGKNPVPSLRVQNQSEAFFNIHQDLPLPERQAKSLAYALIHEPVLLILGEKINGQFYHVDDPMYSYAEDDRWENSNGKLSAEKRIQSEMPWFSSIASGLMADVDPLTDKTYLINREGFPGHIAWNYDLILSIGVEGLIDRTQAYLTGSEDGKAIAFYQGVLISLQAVLEWNRRHIAVLYHWLEEADGSEKEAILQNIRVMEQVPARPARTFHEALQSFYFIFLCVMYEMPYGGNSPGRLDYFLWKYLQPELDSGALTYQGACELLAELFIKIDERVHPFDGHVNTVVIGGVKPDGSDAVNPLSYMMMDVFQELNITHPAVYTRISKQNPPEYIDRCVEYLLNGGNRSQVLSDEAMIAAITMDGHIPFEDAAMYVCGGCMEISPHGMNSDLLFSFLFNTPKALELAITGGKCLVTGKKQIDLAQSLIDFQNFDDFYEWFLFLCSEILTAKFRSLDIITQEMAHHRPGFLISSMISDCLERGRSMNEGGARYHDYGGTPIALQHVADSLFAIKRAVFIDKFCTAERLIQSLENNFNGDDVLYHYLLSIPKYGMDMVEPNQMMNTVLKDVTGIFSSYRTCYNGRVKPMIFNFVWSPSIGNNLGASADGRKAKHPVAHGLTPQAAGLKHGITNAMHSYLNLSNVCISGGGTTMWDMDHQWATFPMVKSILLSFLASGGQIFQGNMTDVGDLQRALEKPEDYQHLIVRVGGFSARFTHLDSAVQREIIERYRHNS